jgi:thiol-disulfide isomerase/thioredoxin
MKIIKVTPNNIDQFNKEIKTPNLIAFVKIYSDNCGHCKDLAPKWTQLERELKNEDMNGLLASIPVEHLDDVDCDTENKGVPTLRVYEGGVRKMDYEGNRKTADMKLFFKNLLKTKKGGGKKKRKKYRKKGTIKRKRTRKRTRKQTMRRTRKRPRKRPRKRTRKRKGGICLTKKCREEKKEKLEKKQKKQINQDFENEKYKLAWEICDMTDKKEYYDCINEIVGKKKKSVDELIKDIDLTVKSNMVKLKQPLAPKGLHRRTLSTSLHKGGRKKRKKTKNRKK